MSKNKIIIISVVTGIFAILISCYLSLVPGLIDLNSYKSLISDGVKTNTGLDLNIGNVHFRTNLNLSVDVFADKIKLNYADGKNLMYLDNASVNVPLLPLVFKNIEIKGVKLNSPEINLYRDKNGVYSIEPVLKNLKPSDQKQDFKLVNGIDIEIKNYHVKFDDDYYKTPQKFVLTGDLIKISDFNPEKYIKLETKGKLLVQNNPNINFDIKFSSELPFLTAESDKKQDASFNPLDGIVKYNFKTNIIANIRLRNVQKDADIDGYVNFDGLSLKIKDKILPESYGKLDFRGKSFNIDSKLFITPESYILVNGKIIDIKKNKLNLNVKTSELNLKDVKSFAEALNDLASLKIAGLNDSDISGKLKADFEMAGNSDFKGYLNVLNTNIAYKGISKPIKNLNSIIRFEGNKLVFNDTYGFIDDNRFNINGFIDSNSNADLKLAINSFNIKTILDLVNQSSTFKELKPQFKDIKSLYGTIKVEAAAKGNLNSKINPEVRIYLINPFIVHKQAGFPVELTRGNILLTGKTAKLNDIQANILQSPVYISGNIDDVSDKTPKPQILVKIPSFNMSKIKLLSNSTLLDKNSKNLINSIKNSSGSVSANIKISQDQKIAADMAINKVSVYYAPSNLPISINSGTLVSDGSRLEIKNLNIIASNSPIGISGTVTSLAKLPEVDLKASGYIAASDVKKYSSPDIRKSVAVRGNIPINASVAGYVDGWKLNSQVNIDNLSYIANINNSGSKLLKVTIKGTPSSLTFIDSGLFASGSKLVSITGRINKYNSSPVLNDVKIDLSGLNLSLVEPKGKLQLNGYVLISGNASKPKTTGNISVKNISVPSMYLTSDSIAIALKNNEILVNTGILNLIDSKFKIYMALDNNFASPLIVNKIDVSSDYMNADKLQKAFPPVPYQDVPVIVKKGKFSADKMIINGLQTTNTSLDFVINPMNILKATNLITSAAGGTASGKINMNLKNSKVSVDINTKNMEVNTLASAFANISNEIYGDMNGNIDVSTYGYTPEETSNNAKGNIVFTIANGKLVRLGSITNLLKGGFSSQLIDSILTFNEAKTSNQFKQLTGNISLNNGAMIINELCSQGGDMSLFSKGTIRMSNNYADITTLGTLSDRITSRLGRIPDFSVDKLIEDKLLKKIPGQWGQVISDIRPKPKYPDIDKIPPLSRGSSETDRHFVVKIKGNLYSPASVKSFKVID